MDEHCYIYEQHATSWDFVQQSSVPPFKVDPSILQSNGGELGSTGLVISPLVLSGWLDQCNAVERSPFVPRPGERSLVMAALRWWSAPTPD